jgi:ketosteroid isomerase-like protein
VRTPREVFQQLSDGIGSGDWSALHLLYDENAEVTIPFRTPDGVRIHGREQVREHFARFGGRISLVPRDVRVYETTDPELIVAEFDYAVGDRTLPNIQVLRVRDGLIVETHDYHHHVAITEMMS